VFRTWELAGHYPAILQDPVVGEAARNLYADASRTSVAATLHMLRQRFRKARRNPNRCLADYVVHTELWGYAAGQQLENEALVREEYQGTRPTPGYPACPVHAQKEILFRLLDKPGQVGMQHTEIWAMLSAARWYLLRREAAYFGVGEQG
jgi:cobalamin-dependent methionine synthase I